MIKMKKILVTFILNIILVLSLSINAYAEASAWARNDINKAIQLGLVPSSLQRNFQSNITRDEFCLLAVKMFEVYSNKTIDEVLENIDASDYTNPFKEKNLSKDVLACYKLGIVSGDDTGHFRPSDNINRQEAAKILTILTNIFGTLEDQELIDFEDRDKIQNWATEYVDFVVLKGIMNGVKNGNHINFEPKSPYTIQQAIVTILRLYNNISTYNEEIVYNVDNFTLSNLDGLSNELKVYNFNFDSDKEKFNYVDTKITQGDYEFKVEMIDRNNKRAEINVIGKYEMLSSVELDGNMDENELVLKYYDDNEKEYLKILKYEGDHFDTLLTLVNIEYFGNEIKADGHGKIFGVYHTLSDGSVNGYYDLNNKANLERVINKKAEITTTVKQNMIGAKALYQNKSVVINEDLINTLHLNIGDEVIVSELYSSKNFVTVTTSTGDKLRVVVTK